MSATRLKLAFVALPKLSVALMLRGFDPVTVGSARDHAYVLAYGGAATLDVPLFHPVVPSVGNVTLETVVVAVPDASELSVKLPDGFDGLYQSVRVVPEKSA